MSQTTLVIHVVPIQISLTGSTATITCDDSRASLVGDELIFTLNARNPSDPEAQQRVCFVVQDPADSRGYDNYLNMSSAPPLERLVAWKRTADVSRSPEMLPGHDFDVVAVVYSASQGTAAAKVGHGNRRVLIRDESLGGKTEY